MSKDIIEEASSLYQDLVIEGAMVEADVLDKLITETQYLRQQVKNKAAEIAKLNSHPSMNLEEFRTDFRIMEEQNIYTKLQRIDADDHLTMIITAVSDPDGQSMGELISYMSRLTNDH